MHGSAILSFSCFFSLEIPLFSTDSSFYFNDIQYNFESSPKQIVWWCSERLIFPLLGTPAFDYPANIWKVPQSAQTCQFDFLMQGSKNICYNVENNGSMLYCAGNPNLLNSHLDLRKLAPK